MNQQAVIDNPPLNLQISDVMEVNYLDYAMSVITGRALPDARDGLKPVHRRILYAMNSLNIGPSGAHKKSARIVGDVIGKYHPHGDSAVYEAAVRMAQPWVMQVPLVDGQGNFGSMDGDGAAAMRYTEMRMTKAGAEFFKDITKNTVDYRDNYDGSEREPVVLPVSYPNLWVNGSEGIAVGMATSIPPHNLRETCNAFNAWMENKQISELEIAKIMPGPDFPTRGLMHGTEDYIRALKTGFGKVMVRARYHTEDRRSGTRLVITEIPYLVNKAKLVESIAELVQQKDIEGIVDLRDESNKKGIRIAIDIKSGYDAENIALKLIKMTQLEKSISYNVRALVDGKPKQLGIKEIFEIFRKHRIEIIQRRTQYDLNETLKKMHLLVGQIAALDRLDETIQTIRNSQDGPEARINIQALLEVDEIQADNIVSMRLESLTSLQILDIKERHKKLTLIAQDLRDILASDDRQHNIMLEELEQTNKAAGIDRATEISHVAMSIDSEDLIDDEPAVLITTKNGYIKRVSDSLLKKQARGTRGRSLIDLDDGDAITGILSTSTTQSLLAITDKGQVHSMKVFQIPESTANGKGRHFRSLVDSVPETAMLSNLVTIDESQGGTLVFVTSHGYVKRTDIAQFSGASRKGGIAGITLSEEGESVVSVEVSVSDKEKILMVANNSRATVFTADNVRPMGRSSHGVCGMKLEDHEKIIYATVLTPEKENAMLVTVSEKGIGKKSPVNEFTPKGRGGKGMMCYSASSRSGALSAATLLADNEDLMLIDNAGTANRIPGESVRAAGRATAGSALMNTKNNILVKAVSILKTDSESEPESEDSAV